MCGWSCSRGRRSPSWGQRLLAAEHVIAMRGLCAELERAFHAGPTALFAAIDRLPAWAAAQDNPLSALVHPKLGSAYRGRLHSLGRFRLLAHAISGAGAPRDPWLAELMGVDELGAGTRLWLDHEVFGPLEVRVAR